jgi:hypothetical protein
MLDNIEPHDLPTIMAENDHQVEQHDADATTNMSIAAMPEA